MPWTLWRYTVLEMWRLIGLSAGVLVSVIAFAAAVKPLADGDLEPGGALAFMLLAVPPMLAYAVPFAAGFGATLAYYRMAQDNEVVAALAGGLSHRTLLAPAAITGVCLALVLAGLNEQVIPRFLRSMERMVSRDLAQAMTRQIQRGEPARLENMEVYADGVQRFGADASRGILDSLRLRGVVAVETDRLGTVKAFITSEEAWVVLVAGAAEGFEESAVAGVIVLNNGYGSSEESTGEFDRLPLDPFPVPDAFEDDPKFLTAGALAALREHPERMSFVESRRLRLARRVAATESINEIARGLAAGEDVPLSGPGGVVLNVRGAGVTPVAGGWRVLPSPGRPLVEVERITPREGGAREIDTIEAEDAVLRAEDPSRSAWFVAGGRPDGGLAFELVVRGATVRSPSAPAPVERAELRQTGLTLRYDPMSTYAAMRAAPLLRRARDVAAVSPEAGPNIAEDADNLERRIARLGREITSKQHERLAMAASCFVMVVTGATMAMRLRDRLPLVVYLWSFFPALLTLILISAGQQHAHGESLAVGLPLLWSGVVGLAAYTFAAISDLGRH